MIDTINRDELKQALHSGLFEITFTKVNGDTRIMTCTLKEDLLPQQIELSHLFLLQHKQQEIVTILR